MYGAKLITYFSGFIWKYNQSKRRRRRSNVYGAKCTKLKSHKFSERTEESPLVSCIFLCRSDSSPWRLTTVEELLEVSGLYLLHLISHLRHVLNSFSFLSCESQWCERSEIFTSFTPFCFLTIQINKSFCVIKVLIITLCAYYTSCKKNQRKIK